MVSDIVSSMNKFWFFKFLIVLSIFLTGLTNAPCLSANQEEVRNMPRMVLEAAVMCSAIDNFKPSDPAVVFSISQGEVFCYSSFDPVNVKTYIFHKWYKRDKLISTMRLTLSPPKWASFSSIKTRNADKGPWRVEIRDVDDRLLKTLRFSVAD